MARAIATRWACPPELGRHVMETVAETNLLQSLAGKGALVAGTAAVHQRHHHIVDYVERGDEMEALENEAEGLVAQGGKGLVRQAGHILAHQFDLARSGRVEQADDI